LRRAETHKNRRRLSFKLNNSQTNKMCKPGSLQDTSHLSNQSSPRPHPSLPEITDGTDEYNVPSDRTETAQNDERWSQGMGAGLENDAPRYVHNQDPERSYGTILSSGPESSWPGFSPATGMAPFSQGHHRCQSLEMPQDLLLFSPQENIASLSFSNQSEFPEYVHSQWPETHRTQMDHIEPG